ncbi:tectonic-3-like isoform X3 [Garra rufa]|uniref:tectonic-3-like isoform X3 n=1 Tax=Garra rufa TaxID=137080 RepID=UPI003CCEE50A
MSKGVFCRAFQLLLIPVVCTFPRAIYCQNTTQYDAINSSVLPASAALNATITDGSAVLSTDATTEPTSPAATNSSATQSIINQTPKSTDLSQYPLTFTENAPTITNQLGLTTTEASDELRVEINSTNSTDSSAIATLNNGTFKAGSAVLPTSATTEPSAIQGCLCDITPDFCDIGCCCDVMDCGLLNLSSVFNSCSLDVGSGVCLETWLMFRAQIDPALITLNGNLFCVQREKEKQSAAQASSVQFQPKSLYPFLLRELTAFNSQKSNFYKVDDIVLTYYDRTSMVSTLRLPSPGLMSSACINHNPARFLHSSSLSCSRAVTAQSCVDDSSLNALTYYTGFSLLKIPSTNVENRPELVIPISMVRDWPEPCHLNGSCLNVVSKVEYVIKYTSKGEISEATLNIELLNTTADTQLLQKHVVIFQETCETGCLLPVSLSVQVLWAQRGLRALPQNHILGAKFIFSCQRLKCPLRSSVSVTTEVIFSEATVYPEAPWGEFQPEWKFPYPFFPRAGEFAQD